MLSAEARDTMKPDKLSVAISAEIRRCTYRSAVLQGVWGWGVLTFQADFAQWLGGLEQVTVLGVAAAISLACNLGLMRSAARCLQVREEPSYRRNESMTESDRECSPSSEAAPAMETPAEVLPSPDSAPAPELGETPCGELQAEPDGIGIDTGTWHAAYRRSTENIAAVMAAHFLLDKAMDDQLQNVVAETETAAINLNKEVCTLSEAAHTLVNYLNSVKSMVDDMEAMTSESVASIGHFVRELPDRVRRNNAVMRSAAKEIDAMAKLVEEFKDIGRQANMLATNPSVNVLGPEVRKLSERSESAVALLEKGFANARQAMNEGLEIGFLSDTAQMAEAINALQERYDDMREYYEALFAVVNQYNSGLAAQIGDISGHIQFQDVVRQRIERLCMAAKSRNTLFHELTWMLFEPESGLETVPEKMQQLVDDYQAEEARHGLPDGSESETGSLSHFELF